MNENAERYKYCKPSHKKIKNRSLIVSDYVELKACAQNCNFGLFLSQALRDRLVWLAREHFTWNVLKASNLT